MFDLNLENYKKPIIYCIFKKIDYIYKIMMRNIVLFGIMATIVTIVANSTFSWDHEWESLRSFSDVNKHSRVNSNASFNCFINQFIL